MLYKVIGTDIKFNGQRYLENSFIDLSEEEAESLSSFLEAVEEKPLMQYSIVQLKDLASKENISLEGCKNKADMVAKIEESLTVGSELTTPES